MMAAMNAQLLQFAPATSDSSVARPLFTVKVSAGYPCPADDSSSEPIDLNEHLISHPRETFFVRVQGESMINAGIHDGDLLIVDRALKVKDGSIVIALLDGEFTVKRIQMHLDCLLLMPENPSYPPITVTDEMNFEVWGVVTNVIHALA